MTWLVLLVLTVGAGFVQTLLPGLAWLGQVKCPLLLGLVIYYAMQRETEVMLVAAVLAGVMQDALSPVPLGLSALLFILVGASLARFRELVMSDAVVTQAFFGLVGAGVTALLQCLLLLATRTLVLSPGAVLLKVFGMALGGLVGTPVMFKVAGVLDRMAGNIRVAKEVEGTDSELDGITG